MIRASCHCGAVHLEASRRPRQLTECSCSICRRYGALWAYYSQRTARVTSGRSALASYSWRNGTLRFFHCGRCGCVTHHERARKTRTSTVAINARLFPPGVVRAAKIKGFDGAARLGEGTY